MLESSIVVRQSKCGKECVSNAEFYFTWCGAFFPSEIFQDVATKAQVLLSTLSIHPSSIHPFTHLFTHPAIHSSIYPFIHLSIQHLCTESVYAKHSSMSQRLSNKEKQEKKSCIPEAFILVSHGAINKINQQSLQCVRWGTVMGKVKQEKRLGFEALCSFFIG